MKEPGMTRIAIHGFGRIGRATLRVALGIGKHWVAPEIGAKLAVRMVGAELTPREIEVLQQLAQGKSNQEIAAALTMSEGTVKYHINHVLQKLGAADRTQAVLTALKRGFAYLA